MAEKSRNPDETWTEEEVFGWLTRGSRGSSEDHRYKRIRSLEELKRRVITDSLIDIGKTIENLLNTAKTYGGNNPECSLIVEILALLIRKDNEVFEKVLDRLKISVNKQMFCFSKLVRLLDQERKKRSVRPLVSFLMGVGSLNAFGVNEVYECLVTMDGEEIRNEILKFTSPKLDSLEIFAVVFAVKICSKLGDATLNPMMLKVFERSFIGYYLDHERRIQREICNFFKRIPDRRSLPLILKLTEMEFSTETSEALARIFDAYPEVLEDVYQSLEKARDPRSILYAFAKMKKELVDFDRVLNSTIKDIGQPNIYFYLKDIALKVGESAKPTLLRMAKSKVPLEYEFSIFSLNEMGVDFNKIASVFEEDPVLQLINFFSEKKPKFGNLYKLWNDRIHLTDDARGDMFEHLILTIFSTFHFITLHVPTLRAVDIVAFSPNTFHLYIIGCTTGALTDDVRKLGATVAEIRQKLAELFDKYEVVPLIFTSQETEFEYPEAIGMVIFTPEKIDKLLEMLGTGRTTEDLNKYILQNVVMKIEGP